MFDECSESHDVDALLDDMRTPAGWPKDHPAPDIVAESILELLHEFGGAAAYEDVLVFVALDVDSTESATRSCLMLLEELGLLDLRTSIIKIRPCWL